ncbi:MAG: ABC transporter ATP-binding protein [Nocardioides sp.]
MTGLRVSGLSRSFGATRVLDGIDLDVPGGITAVLGSSGCGKTTLLRLIAGFLAPDAGSITIGGEVVAEPGRSVPPRARRIGYVPQEGALFPHLDVAANVGFGLTRAARRSTRVAEMLDLVELSPAVATRFPHELSGGQQQRVALARALAPDPALILLDEPFSSLDAGLREDTGRAVARALRASGATGVLVTHDQGEALSLADQVAVMVGGRFLQVARPDEIYLNPATSTVAGFVGNATLLPGTAVGGTARCALGQLPLVSAATGEVLLAVRPEQVLVTDLSGAGPAAGVVAEVLDVSFFGHDATLRARVIEPDSIGSAPTVVIARVPSGGVPAPGTKVELTVVGPVLAFDGTPGA